MQATDYSRALYERIREGADAAELLARLDGLLSKRGHSKLKRPILVGLSERLALAEREGAPRLMLARSDDRTERTASIELDVRTLGLTAAPDPVIDESLIGGHILEYRFRRIDRSYKTALCTLYTNVTNTTTV